MRHLFYILLMLAPSLAYAQSGEIDSLLQRVKEYPRVDTTYIKLLNDLTFDYAYSEPTEGIQFANKSIKLAAQIAYHKGLAMAYNYKGLCLGSIGRDSLALCLMDTAIYIATNYQELAAEASALNNKAILLTNLGRYKEALTLRLQVFSIFQKLGDTRRMGTALSNIAVSFYHLGDYRQSIAHNLQSLKYVDKRNTVYGNVLMNIGLNYKKIKNYDKAFEYYTKALNVYRNYKNFHNEINLLSALATLFDEKGEIEKALSYYQTALTKSRSVNYRHGEANILTDIGIVYRNQHRYGEAFSYFQKASDILKDSGDDQLIAIIHTEYAEILLNASDNILEKQGISSAKKFQVAQAYAKDAVKKSRAIGATEREMDARRVLSHVYEKLGHYEAALSEFKQYTTLQDSLLKDEAKIDIARQEIQFEADKKEAIAQAEIRRQRVIKNFTIWGAVLAILLATAGFIFYRKQQRDRQIKKELIFKAQLVDIEMHVLRLQLNPHFIFNCLNSIADYLQKNEPTKADYYLSKFSKLMRKILENSEEKEIPLSEELTMLTLYMQLQGSRLKDKFSYHIDVADNIDPERTFVPPLILQPFVENNIWHGLSTKEGQGLISIHITKGKDLLYCTIEDDGIGFKPTVKMGKKSFGIKIIQDRIKMLKKTNTFRVILPSRLYQKERV